MCEILQACQKLIVADWQESTPRFSTKTCKLSRGTRDNFNLLSCPSITRGKNIWFSLRLLRKHLCSIRQYSCCIYGHPIQLVLVPIKVFFMLFVVFFAAPPHRQMRNWMILIGITQKVLHIDHLANAFVRGPSVVFIPFFITLPGFSSFDVRLN